MRRTSTGGFGRVARLTCALTMALWAASCAQQVGDIDRTQPNKTLKADLEGTWYMLETVTEVPATSSATFIGETSKMEKVVWRVEEDVLLAYRSYPIAPGAEDLDGGVDYASDEVYGNPIAAYPIQAHFDVQRQYNAATGEQSNVIVENTQDRPWFERDYMRVDWSQNLVTSFDFVSEWLPTPTQITFKVDAERGEAASIHWEREGDDLVYFDVPRKMILEPDLWGCAYSWWGWGMEDCGSSEIEVVTSFAKTAPRRDYEPVVYDDNHMSRFGYFRSERYGVDPQRGVRESSRLRMINRHNLWEASYKRDGDGDFLKDDQGRLVPIPMNERTHRTVPYYLSQNYPDDALILEAARDTMAQWDAIGRETVALAQGVAASAITKPVFVLCNNPVAQDDDPACGDEGMVAREGDLRYSTLHWVESEQLQGPLGYGPSATDPETGEIVSGRAYMYGGGLNGYASYGLDIVRFINGDLDGPELAFAENFRADVERRARASSGLERVDPALERIPLDRERVRRADRDRFARREARRRSLRPFDAQQVDARLEKARQSGISALPGSGGADEAKRALAARLERTHNHAHGPAMADLHADPATWLNPTRLKEIRRRRMRAIGKSVDFADLFDPHVAGIAEKYKGRTDYDQVWRELRAEVFKATALHEVGHTVGLRHNFQGSYDALNYFDRYWELRQETLFAPDNQADLYRLHTPTANQLQSGMREHQYSSIMDYGLTFNSDLKGLGRYDRAALVYGYTFGAEAVTDGACDALGQARDPETGACLGQAAGFVETFTKPADQLGDAADIFHDRDEQGFLFSDPTAPIIPYLERWHYTTVLQSFPTLEDAFDRTWRRLGEVERTREAGLDTAFVRVPYLFCSDEWVGAMLSCNVFDAGADPFELVKTTADRYRTYYYFDNFKRDRLGWDAIDVLFRHFFYTFLPMSDYYQNWYLSPDGYDEVLDDYYWLATNMAFNVVEEALATPPYGTYCTGKNGQLVNLSDEPGGDPNQASDYFLDVYCDNDAPFYQIEPGQGRRRFTRYDVESGYYFSDRPLEAGHYWTTLAAFWALVDPEAYVLGSDADVGTFSISFLDFFDDEVHTLVNAIINEDYAGYSPRLQLDSDDSGAGLGLGTGVLRYAPRRGIYDPELRMFFNPETGELVNDAQGPPQPGAALCQPCEANGDCSGFTGALGGAYCQPLADDVEGTFCLQDCTNDPSACLEDETCDPAGNCVPNSFSCEGRVFECDAEHPLGACPDGLTCADGTCQRPWPVVETDATFSLVDDIFFYGMLYSTFGFSTRYNDQLNVFKMGTGEEVMPGPGFTTVQFTDPLSGDTFGAVREDCVGPENSGEAPPGGSSGLCAPCTADADCAGHTGFLDGTYCQPLADDVEGFFCLQDCTNNPGFCQDDETCDDLGNCVPNSFSCEGREADCGADNPLGTCPDGEVCSEGVCIAPPTPFEPSVRCQYGLNTDAGAALMVLRGQELAERYNTALDAYWGDDGSDPDRELSLFRAFSRARFDLEYHIQKINTERAVYAIFGKIY